MRDSLVLSLDPFLRQQIQKRGITFISNTYTGFDSEFTLKDSKKYLNSIVSVQCAVQTRALIKVPLYYLSDISYVHPLTSEITNYYKPRDSYLFSNEEGEGVGAIVIAEMSIINDSLKYCIEKIRKFKFSTLDQINSEIIEKLKTVQGVNYYVDASKDSIVFALPLSEVYTKITYPESYSIKNLVLDSNCLGFHTLEDSFNNFVNLLSNLTIDTKINLQTLKL
jgi:hypothetical protein